MRKYYLTVAVPRMLYAADVFLVPEMLWSKGTKGVITKLNWARRQAVLLITGVLRSTATDILDVHANLLPFHLLMSQVVHRAATRLACLPDFHPLAKIVQRVVARRIINH